LGGIIGIPIIGYLSGEHLWRAAFVVGAGFAVASALAWLGIEVDQPADAAAESAAARCAAAQ
jgi:hypothetical protein